MAVSDGGQAVLPLHVVWIWCGLQLILRVGEAGGEVSVHGDCSSAAQSNCEIDTVAYKTEQQNDGTGDEAKNRQRIKDCQRSIRPLADGREAIGGGCRHKMRGHEVLHLHRPLTRFTVPCVVTLAFTTRQARAMKIAT